MYRRCGVLKQEVEIQKMRVEMKLSYGEAAKEVKTQVFGQKLHPWGLTGGTNEVSKENVSIGKKELVTSIAGVINSTAGVKSKTQKI